MKVKHKKRNIKLEKELQDKILAILSVPKYKDVPMLAMNGLIASESEDDIILDTSAKYYFIISNNIFKSKYAKSRKKS